MTHLVAVVSEDTGVTIGLAIVVVGALLGCAWWIATKISKVDAGISSITARLKHIETEHYTKVEAEAHALRLALENPGLNVPDPRNPGQLIRASKV